MKKNSIVQIFCVKNTQKGIFSVILEYLTLTVPMFANAKANIGTVKKIAALRLRTEAFHKHIKNYVLMSQQ